MSEGRNDALLRRTEEAVADALSGRHVAPPEVFAIGGFCGAQSRALVNRLCRDVANTYLEVGVLHGAMLCSALAGNEVWASGVDDFSQFDGDAETVLANCARFAGERGVDFRNADMLSVDPLSFGLPVELFFYDADHSAEATAAAIRHYLPALSQPFLLLVDDYEWEAVRLGVTAALWTNQLTVLREWTLRPRHENDGDTFWNGMYLAVVEQPGAAA